MKTITRVLALFAFLALVSFNAPAQTPTTAPAIPTAPTSSTAPAVLPEQPAQEIVANPYSLTALWQGGDVIARGTIVILAIMSMGTWYVLITKFVEQALLLRHGREANRNFWSAANVRAGAEGLGSNSAFRMVVEDGLKAAEHHEGKLTEQIDRHSWITLSLQRSVDAISNRLQGGLAVLATVGSTAPFVGLFGTVWGIYHALTAIGIAGQVGEYRQGCRTGRRSADHDRDRPGGRRARRARLQLDGPPQQGGDGSGAQLLGRSPRAC